MKIKLGQPLSQATLAEWGFENGQARHVLAEGEFELHMTISDQELELVVYDLAMEEPYTLFEVVSASGALVTALRQQVDDILNRILGQQIQDNPLVERLVDHVATTYGLAPAHPFKRHPEIIGFKVPTVDKLFGIFLPVDYCRLDKTSTRTDQVLVLNLKCQPDQILERIDNCRYFPAYHMNKKHWFSVLLDAQTDWDQLTSMLAESYRLVKK